MKVITKQQLKAIKEGNTAELLRAFENLIDHYESRAFDDGYNSCVMDLSVYAGRLALEISSQCGGDRDHIEDLIKNFFKDTVEVR